MDINQAAELTASLMRQHGLLQAGWTWAWDDAKSRMGCCWIQRKKITLSKALFLINELDECKDTILHEIAHALAPADAHHGWAWKHKAQEIGARPERCYSRNIVNIVTYRFRAICNHCGTERHETGLRNPGTTYCRPCAKAAGEKYKQDGTGWNIRQFEMNWQNMGLKVILARKNVPQLGTVAPAVPVRTMAAAACAQAPAAAPALAVAGFDSRRAVALYAAGNKVVDIAVSMGYARGQGQNRVRAALVKAGVYKAGR